MKKYDLETIEGLKELLNDLPTLKVKRMEGNYEVSDLLMDIERAMMVIESDRSIRNRPTPKQMLAARLVHIDGYTLEEAARFLGVTHTSTVEEHAEKYCEKLVRVFQEWNYSA